MGVLENGEMTADVTRWPVDVATYCIVADCIRSKQIQFHFDLLKIEFDMGPCECYTTLMYQAMPLTDIDGAL